MLLWVEGKEAVSRAGPALQGRVKTHFQGSHGALDTPLPQPWTNVIRTAPGDALAESWVGCSGSEGHRAAAITAVTSSWHGATGLTCGLSRPAETPTPHAHPAAQGRGKPGGHGMEGSRWKRGTKGGGRNDTLFPGLLCLSLLPSRRLFVLHASTCTLSFF